MTDPTVLVNPHCLCGHPHPCPLHGAWAGTPPHVEPVQLDGRYLLHLLEADDELADTA